MNSQRKIFWIFLFVAVVFCCALYFSAKVERTKMQIAIGTKLQGNAISAENTLNTPAMSASGVPVPTLPATLSRPSAAVTVVPVSRVIDGDTIVVSLGGRDETVRLLGMDTPETVDPRKPVQCFGPEASLETKSLLDGREVTLQSDPTQSDRDKYGRLLRYVFRDDGLFVDEFLVQQGFAREYTYFGVVYKYQTAFRLDQNVARLAGLGLWATSTCDGKI
jgi:micrococcal nuclease